MCVCIFVTGNTVSVYKRCPVWQWHVFLNILCATLPTSFSTMFRTVECLYTNISLRACVRPRKIAENVFSKVLFVRAFSSVHILKTFSPVSVSPQFIYTFLTSTCYGRGWIKQKACLGVTVDRLVGVSRAVNKALPGLLLPSQRKRRTVPIVAIYSCVHFCYLGHGCFLPLVRKRYFIRSSAFSNGRIKQMQVFCISRCVLLTQASRFWYFVGS